MRGYRVWAEIDLDAYRHNVTAVAGAIGVHTCLMAVVKADAYGHGAVPISYKAIEAGAHMLGVGDSSEALELRASGISAPILILGAVIEEEIRHVVENEIQVTVHSRDLLGLLDREGRRQGKPVKVHLKVDTGMTRLGVSPEGAPEVAAAIRSAPNLIFGGLSTHLASAPGLEHSHRQLDVFDRVVDDLREKGLVDVQAVLLHAANSAAALLLPRARYDMVRPGIALFGAVPESFGRARMELRPVLALKTRIAYLKGVPAGTSIGYDRKHQVAADTIVATCPVGYNDGYPFALSNRSRVLVRGMPAAVIGSVTMDYIMIDVGRVPGASVGDEVTLVGRDGGEEITLQELARLAGTIPYEIPCRLGRRVKRVYANGSSARRPVLSAIRTNTGT